MTTHALLHIADPADRPHANLDWQERLALLRERIAAYGRVVVAYSGGVDSSVVLRVAHEVLGSAALGVIGVSDSYAASELDLAERQAASFEARLERVTTGELADPAFASNPSDRCYHCKSALYRELAAVASREGDAVVLDGTIAEDLADWRPGRRAAAERAVHSPLAELGFSKADVRAVADHFGLASADKPASPCLASRIPYGSPITRENLSQVEHGEQVLRELGFRELRLRHHGDVARIEVPADELARWLEPAVRSEVIGRLKQLGFRWIALDLEGFRSGSLNEALHPPEGASRPS